MRSPAGRSATFPEPARVFSYKCSTPACCTPFRIRRHDKRKGSETQIVPTLAKTNPELPREAGEESAPLAGGFPGQIESAALERRLFSKRRHGMLDTCQWRIIGFLIAAQVVVGSEAARVDFHQIAGLHGRTTGFGAGTEPGFNGRGSDINDLLDQLACHRMREIGQSLALLR